MALETIFQSHFQEEMFMEQLDTNQNNVFSKRIRAGKRTYFFDVKATKSAKDFYIIITESRRVEGAAFEKHKLFLYKEDFEKFSTALTETIAHVEHNLLEKTEQFIAG